MATKVQGISNNLNRFPITTQNQAMKSVESKSSFSETQDFKLATLGNVDSGKSTLCGVLSRGLLDDGRGMARSFVLRHQHEQAKGQTSSVAVELLGFSKTEQIIPKSIQTAALNKTKVSHNKDFYEVATAAEHRCTLVDLCGHEKFLKTTIYGLTGMAPNCAMVIIGANHGVQRMTREHIGLCCALNVPFFIVITKIDMCPENIFKETEIRVKKILTRAGKRGYFVREEDELNKSVELMASDSKITPIFLVSSVSGVGIESLRSFIRQLTVNHATSEKEIDDEIIRSMQDMTVSETDEYAEFFVDDTFQVPGVGVVIGGSLSRGKEICVNDALLVGPDKNGVYKPVVVKSIQRQCVPSDHVLKGQHGTLAIKGKLQLKKNMFHKGMVCIRQIENDAAAREGESIIHAHTVREFEADIKVLHHSTTINPGYSPVVHLGVIRQAAVILSITNDKGEEVVARTGSQVKVRFKFLHAAEYLCTGRAIVFREGRAKGCGKVTKLIPP